MLDRLVKRRLRNNSWAVGLCLVTTLVTANHVVAAPPGKATPTVEIPSVTSTGQQSGVTAGYVNQLTQTVIPTLVRGPQLEKFKATFTTGSRIYRLFYNTNATDSQIDLQCNEVNQWVNETFNWLNSRVSEYAAERFVFRPPGLAYSYNLPGPHAAGYAEKWGNCQRGLAEFLVNLDQLMRDPSVYPEPSVK
jgi:hypothetical protein